MEYNEAGDFLQAFKSNAFEQYSEYTIAQFMKQILESLRFLHSQGMIHKYLSLQNIQFTGKTYQTIKLCEMSLTEDNSKDQDKIKRILANPLYTAPEILNDEDFFEECDIWSAGIICYILLSGTLPFNINEDDDYQSSIKKVNQAEFRRDLMTGSIWGEITDDAKDFLNEMLQKDPYKRAEIEELLNHRWIKNANTNPMDHTFREKLIYTLQNIKVNNKNLSFN